MKKKTLFLAMALFAALAVNAQQRREMPAPEGAAKKMADRLEKVLELSAEQKQQVEEVQLKISKENREALKQYRQANREELMKIRSEQQQKSDEEMKKILTPEQYQKLLEMRQRQQNNRPRRGGSRQ